MPTRQTQTLIVMIAVLVFVALNGNSAVRETEGFTFVHFTDAHIPTYGFAIGLSLEEKDLLTMHNQQRIRRLVGECLAMKPKPAFVVNTGDTTDVGWMPLFRLYSRLMQPLVSAGIPIYTVTGNHDTDYTGLGPGDLGRIFDPLGPAMIDRHGERYSFDLHDCHFAVINNNPICGLVRVNPATLEWLRNDLEKVDKDKRVFVFLHATMSGSDM
ncbi:MAG: metallophosphoesterase [Planctomycetota bacterium]|nr:metallophosphoesterase [Planctomycetota bacterium]